MKIVVITNDAQKEELLTQGIQDAMQLEWQHEPEPVADADGYIDLLFSLSAERMDKLKKLQPSVILVNSIINTLDELPDGFTRFNGWPGFLKRPLTELAGPEENRATVQNIFSGFNKATEWVPDIPGFITPRIISTIINEAYFTLAEKVSTKEEIDTAMKLGTNYPYGPFEWAEKIGLKNVYALLAKLAETNSRYTPSSLLQKEALV